MVYINKLFIDLRPAKMDIFIVKKNTYSSPLFLSFHLGMYILMSLPSVFYETKSLHNVKLLYGHSPLSLSLQNFKAPIRHF
jgi:hypothetical protein